MAIVKLTASPKNEGAGGETIVKQKEKFLEDWLRILYFVKRNQNFAKKSFKSAFK